MTAVVILTNNIDGISNVRKIPYVDRIEFGAEVIFFYDGEMVVEQFPRDAVAQVTLQ